jgi:hypothetical protein
VDDDEGVEEADRASRLKFGPEEEDATDMDAMFSALPQAPEDGKAIAPAHDSVQEHQAGGEGDGVAKKAGKKLKKKKSKNTSVAGEE